MKNKKGFTLVELIVVIAIIGILAAVLIPSITGYIRKARFSSDQQDASNMTMIVSTYSAENNIKMNLLTPNEVKTIILTDGQYNLVPRNSLWTFVWNVSESKVEAMYFNDEALDAAETILYPEEVFKNGYYLIGQGNTAIERVVTGIRNFSGTEQEFLELIDDLRDTEFASFEATFKNLFHPDNTFFINSNGITTTVKDKYAENVEETPEEFIPVAEADFPLAADTFIYYFNNTDYEIVESPLLFTKNKNDEGYEEFYLGPTSSKPTSQVFVKIDTEEGTVYKSAYVGVVEYKTVTRVLFGDRIWSIPAFGDKINLPLSIAVPATIDFISEGAFSGVLSPTKLLFSGNPVFEEDFKYNSVMLSANGGVQPRTTSIDLASKGIALMEINIGGIDYESGSFVTMSEESIKLAIGSFKQQNDISKLSSAEFRFGYSEDVKFDKDGLAYVCKFVVKLYSNGKLVGYSCIYYREIDVKTN